MTQFRTDLYLDYMLKKLHVPVIKTEKGNFRIAISNLSTTWLEEGNTVEIVRTQFKERIRKKLADASVEEMDYFFEDLHKSAIKIPNHTS